MWSLGFDPVDGHVYVFSNRRRRIAKALSFDGGSRSQLFADSSEAAHRACILLGIMATCRAQRSLIGHRFFNILLPAVGGSVAWWSVAVDVVT